MPRLKRKLGVRSAIVIGCLSGVGAGIGLGLGLLWEREFYDKPVPVVSKDKVDKLESTTLVYSDFFKIDFDSLPTEKIKFPSDLKGLEEECQEDKPEISNPKTLEKLILNEALKLGYNPERIGTLPIKDAIMLGVDIVTSRIEYHLVDSDPDFIEKHGTFLPIDKYFELGLGDCDKYSAALIAVLDTIKKYNPNFENVYVSESVGGFSIGHSWNNITFLTKDGVILTHIDPTWYDGGCDLEAERGEHIPENDKELFARFHADIYNFKESYTLHSEILNDTEDEDIKERILAEMAYSAYQLEDKPKMDEVREQYLRLEVQDDLDDILYYSWRIEKKAGNHDGAEQFKQQLLDKCPDSFWVKYVNK